MPEPLTTLERRILDYLIDYLRRNTYQPSIREIGRRFDIKSTKTVSEYLQSLADKGWIERDPSRSRGVRLLRVDLSGDTVSVPCYPAVDADGDPVAGEAPVEAYVLDRRLAGSSGAYFLLMKGASMEAAGIRDGDLLLVEPVAEIELEDGDIVVARLAGEATVKLYFRRDDEVVLEPANANFPPILVRAQDFSLAGRVLTVFRRLRPAATEAALRSAREDGEAAAR